MFSKQIIIKVDGMKCNHCASKVQTELNKINGVKSVKVNLESKKVTIKYKKDIDLDNIRSVIDNLGYSFIGVED